MCDVRVHNRHLFSLPSGQDWRHSSQLDDTDNTKISCQAVFILLCRHADPTKTETIHCTLFSGINKLGFVKEDILSHNHHFSNAGQLCNRRYVCVPCIRVETTMPPSSSFMLYYCPMSPFLLFIQMLGHTSHLCLYLHT